MSRSVVGRRHVAVAALLIVVGSLGVQASSSMSMSLFPSLGVPATSAFRLTVGAVVLLVVFRPSLRGRSRMAWVNVVVYGLSMAAMNLCLYLAVERLPLGVAVTLEFLGPCAVALLGSRRWMEAACALGALAGVALIAGPGGVFNPLGYLAGLGAATSFGLYTVFSERVGQSQTTLPDLALSVAVAAAITLPWSFGRISDLRPASAALVACSALVGIALPYVVDTLAARISSARVVGTLFSVDPMMGLLVGWLFLGQRLTWGGAAGIAVVTLSGAVLVWVAKPVLTE